MLKKTELFEKLSSEIGINKSTKIDLLAKIVFENREKIKKLLNNNEEIKNLYKKDNHTNWYLFLADYREFLGLPRFMDLNLFNSFTEIIISSGEELNYDEFLKIFKASKVKSKVKKNYKGPDVSKIINNQGEYLAQGLVEIIANAIDATITNHTIGRFGEGFYQSLKFLKGGNSQLVVKTKKEDEKGFLIHIKNENGENKLGSVGISKESIGTEVKLEKKLSKKEQKSLIDFVKKTFKTNKKVWVVLNGEVINNIGEYFYLNSNGLKVPTEIVEVEVGENGFLVVDSGIGMSGKDLCEKLLFPNISSKTRLNSDSMTDEEIEKNTSLETAFFYKYFLENEDKIVKKFNQKTSQKTNIRLQVSGILIEEFFEETSYDLKEFCLELPSFTWLPESRNKIELTKEVVVSLENAIKKIISKVVDQKEKLMLLEIIAKIIKHLKSRESSKASVKSRYDISKVAKNAFYVLKTQLESAGKIVVPSIPQIQDILSDREDIVFIDSEFINFDIEKITGIKKLKNVKDAKKRFYEIEFSTKSQYDYLIYKDIVLVNSKYTKNKKDLDKINAQINLNTGYENLDDRVFYGVIENNEEEKKGENQKNLDPNSENLFSSKEKYSKDQIISFVEKSKMIMEEFHDFLKMNDEASYEGRIYLNNKIIDNDYEILEKEKWMYYLLDLSFEELVFDYFGLLIGTGRKKEFIRNTKKEFFSKFLLFVRENSTNIILSFSKFFNLVYKNKNCEKYLTKIMDLLNDEKNVKYIIGYIKDLEKLSENDIETIFSYFDGEEKIEEKSENQYLMVYKNGGWNAFQDFIQSKFGINSFLTRAIEFKSNIVYVIEILGKQYLYVGDSLQVIDGESEFYNIGTFNIKNGKIESHYKKEENSNIVNFVFDLNDSENPEIKKESEYLKSFKEDGGIEYKKVLAKKYPDILKIDFVGEISGEIFCIVTNKGFTQSFIIGDKKQTLDGEVNFKMILHDEVKLYNGKILLSTYLDLAFGNLCYGGKNLEIDGKTDFDDLNINYDDIEKGIIKGEYRKNGSEFIGFEINLNDLDDKKKESEYLRIFQEEKNWDLLQEYVLQKTNQYLSSIIGERNNDLLYIIIKDGWYSLYIGDNLLTICGQTKFQGGHNIYFRNGKINGYITIEGKTKPFNQLELKDLLPEKFNQNLEQKTDITKKYSRKTLSFVEFLCKGGEFLSQEENQVIFENGEKILLTDIIGISKYFDEDIEKLNQENVLEILEKLKGQIQEKIKNKIPFQRNITSTIDGQDKSSMIWLREVVQNSRDAILKSKRNGIIKQNIDEININFYQNENKWISRIKDNIGMTAYEVFKYLLIPGKSAKENDIDATGMFGQGFYSLAIGASQISLKTSVGDGKTIYIKLIPVYNDNKDIIDFEINYEIKDEYFIGTIIERADIDEGIGGNIGALVGIHNLQKYVGNVADVEIEYNGSEIIKKDDVKILQTQKIKNLGDLTLKQNADNEERLTKDDLFISEIKDEYLEFLPDWIIQYIKKNGYSLDLPSKIGLTKTRNSITDFEENIDILRPNIFNIFCKQIIKDYLDGKIKIPMMPLDYYSLDLYEMQFDENIVDFANRVNKGGILSLKEISKLKDKNLMIQFLINLKINNSQEFISIRELKQNRDNKEKLLKHTTNEYALNHLAKELNTGMESGYRKRIEPIENDKISFLKEIKKDFSPLIKRIFGCKIEFGFYQRLDKDEMRAVDYGFNNNGDIYFNFNNSFWKKFKKSEKYKLIELITHEITHLVEDFVKVCGVDFDLVINGNNNVFSLAIGQNILLHKNKINFGTHQKDLEHEHSFEKIQREILKLMTREEL